ncbi:MAG: dihydrofolate reductase [Bradymonadales bacterium]|nr:MAG: dihydrofolate reductase [Bradymonadales bacterium]
MIISAIAAMSRNRVIGLRGALPWHIPADLKFFKEKTLGKSLIMGRKTFESFPKPLPDRENIVLTRRKGYQAVGAKVFSDLAEAIDYCRSKQPLPDEIFIGGGSEIYQAAMPMLQRIYLTVIEKDFDGDTFFPEIPPGFSLTESQPGRQESPVPLSFEFRTYER